MAVNQFSFSSQFIIRIASVFVSLAFWIVISSKFPVNSFDALTTLAIGLLISSWLPIGSLAHLKRFDIDGALTLSFIIICLLSFLIYVTSPQHFLNSSIKEVLLLTLIVSSCGLERLNIAYAARKKVLWKFFLLSTILRFLGILYITTCSVDNKSLVGTVAIIDSLIRFLSFCGLYSYKQLCKTIKRKNSIDRLYIKPWISASMQNSIYWLPISFGEFLSTNDIAITRVQIFILGFASVFYASDSVISIGNYNRFGLVKSRLQILYIFSMAIAFSFYMHAEKLIEINYGTSPLCLDLFEYFILLAMVLLLLLSWNGAKVVNYHNVNREWRLSLFLFIFSSLTTIAKVDPVLIIFFTCCLWHLFVILFYPCKNEKSTNQFDKHTCEE